MFPDDPVHTVPGVGEGRARLLAKLGIYRVRDLLMFAPRRYQSYAEVQPINKAMPGISGTYVGDIVKVTRGRGSRSRCPVDVLLEDDTGSLTVRFFNSLYLLDMFADGGRLLVTGPVTEYQHRAVMNHPEYEFHRHDEEQPAFDKPGSTIPVYDLTEGINQNTMRKIAAAAVQGAAAEMPDIFPPAFCRKQQFPTMPEALRMMHLPANAEEPALAMRRMKYEEFFLLETAMALRAAEIEREPSRVVIDVPEEVDRRIRALFPFQLTDDQNAAIADIRSDLSGGHPMNRLLQGDVGSGKTVVALYSMLAAIASGAQAALMAPTEILATQHYNTISGFLKKARVKTALLVGAMPQAETCRLHERIAKGKVDLVIGTHALIGREIAFRNLGLVVVDEQHKFGVLQRNSLKEKGRAPHTLVMTATPIPRTLMLSVFGDLDCSVIKHSPSGRGRIETVWVTGNRRRHVFAEVREEVAAGRQAYIVYPLVEENDTTSRAATQEARRLSQTHLKGLRVGLLHGRMTTAEKDQTMHRFARGELDVLVATTVIEVGIDVPNATVMVVEHAERFGLSTLHQLRGRVGRGTEDSRCLLIGEARTEDARSRLEAMAATCDGFEIAEMDLKLRGPGQFFGVRQHGLPELRFGSLVDDFNLLRQARRDAFAVVKADPALTMPSHLAVARAVVAKYKNVLELVSVG